MRFPRRPTPRTGTENAILPLTNVVFLLLIFFMLTGHLAVTQPFDVQPPKSTSRAAAPSRGIQIEIAADGDIALNGRPVRLKALSGAVRRRLAARPQAPLEIKADGRSQATHIVAIMRALHAAGAEKLRLVTISNTP